MRTTRSSALNTSARETRALARSAGNTARARQQQQQRGGVGGGAIRKKKQAPRARGPEFAFELGKTEARPDGTTANLCSAPGCRREAIPDSYFELDTWSDTTDKFTAVKHMCRSDSCLQLVRILSGLPYRGTTHMPYADYERFGERYGYTEPPLPVPAGPEPDPEDSTPDLKFAASLRARLEAVKHAQSGLSKFVGTHLAPRGSTAPDGYITPAYSSEPDPHYSPTSPSYSPTSPSYVPLGAAAAPTDDGGDQAFAFPPDDDAIRREHLLGHPNEGGHTPSGIPGACARGSCAGCLRAGCYDLFHREAEGEAEDEA